MSCNVKFVNEVLYNCGLKAGFEIEVRERQVDWVSYLFANCYIWNDEQVRAKPVIFIRGAPGGPSFTAQEAQDRLAIFQSIVDPTAPAEPTFVRPEIFSEALVDPGSKVASDFFAHLSLSGGAAMRRGAHNANTGRRGAEPPDVLVLARPGDAWCFTPGWGIVPPDAVIIEGQEESFLVTGIVSDSAIRLDRPIGPYEPDKRIWLRAFARAEPDGGIAPRLGVEDHFI
jgi:hypothetical protein